MKSLKEIFWEIKVFLDYIVFGVLIKDIKNILKINNRGLLLILWMIGLLYVLRNPLIPLIITLILCVSLRKTVQSGKHKEWHNIKMRKHRRELMEKIKGEKNEEERKNNQ